MANPDIPLCDLASLNWVSHRVPSSPAIFTEIEMIFPRIQRQNENPQTKKFYICSDVSHTHPAAAGYFFGRHARCELCNRCMASIQRWKLAHSCQYHEEVDSVGCSRCPMARRASMKIILFSIWDPCCSSPDAKAAVHESSN